MLNQTEKLWAVRQGDKFVTTLEGEVELSTRGDAEITAMQFEQTFGGKFQVVYMK